MSLPVALSLHATLQQDSSDADPAYFSSLIVCHAISRPHPPQELPYLGATHSCLQALPTPERPWLGPEAGSDPPPPQLGTPCTILTGAPPASVGEDRPDGDRAQPLTQRANGGGPKKSGQNWHRTVRRQTAATVPLLVNARPPGSVLSHRTGRHPPQQAARPGATQPCLWPTGESGAGLLSEL